MSPWVKDPNAGGKKVPESVQNKVKKRILTYAEKHHAGALGSDLVYLNGEFQNDIKPQNIVGKN